MGPLNPNGRNDPDALPARDAWLQSYLDGELGPEERARVEAWLAEDPSARAEADSRRRLDDLLDEAVIDEPSSPAWDRTLHRVARSLKPRPSRWGERLRPFMWLAAAAAAVGAFWVGTQLLTPAPTAADVLEVADDSDVRIEAMDPFDRDALVVGVVPRGLPIELTERGPFVVARDAEVEIYSMEGQDTSTLVVGLPPVVGPLLMALPGEVSIESIETVKNDDPKPYVYPQQGTSGGMPMIMVERSVRRNP